MYRTGERAKTTLNDSFPFFSPSYLHFPSVKQSRVYLKSQPRQDLLVAVTAADRESAHGRRQRSEPPLCRRCCGSLPVSPPLRTHTRRCRGAVGGVRHLQLFTSPGMKSSAEISETAQNTAAGWVTRVHTHGINGSNGLHVFHPVTRE